MRKSIWKPALFGTLAGAVNGTFGAGGGMVLAPLLRKFGGLQERRVLPTALSVMLPVSAVSFAVCALQQGVDLPTAWPYCLGGVLGGLLAGGLYAKIPLRWLHLALGLLIVWGGVRQFL